MIFLFCIQASCEVRNSEISLADASALMASLPLSQHFVDFHGNFILTLTHIFTIFPLKAYFDLFSSIFGR